MLDKSYFKRNNIVSSYNPIKLITEYISVWELIDIVTARSFAPSKCLHIRT